MTTEKENLKLLLKVAKQHYLLGMKQNEIAEKENLSKSMVSRLINKSIELGYVKFELNFPTITVERLEKELKQKFNLKYVFVAESSFNDENIILSNISDGFSRFLNRIITNGATIGISYGNTMTYISEHLIPLPKKNVRFVQLNGGISNSHRNISTLNEEILINFAKNYKGDWYFLPAPSFVDSPFIANALKQDSKIKEIFNLMEETQIVIFSVGTINKEALAVKAGYFSEQDFMNLRDEGFVGDICSRFIKKDGTQADADLNDRVIGISLDKIKEKKFRVCVAIGNEKAESILAGIKGGFINSLFTDEKTAMEIVRLAKDDEGKADVT